MKLTFKNTTYITLVILIVLSGLKANSQILITKNDSIPIVNDSVQLIIPEHRGNLQWQQSLDNINWVTLNIEESDTLKFKSDTEAYYRAEIKEGTCDPVYSDTIKIDLDSIEKDYINTNIEIAYPDSIGEVMTFSINNESIICEKINNKYVFQGDIILIDEQLQLDYLKGATLNLYKLWPNNIVYYIIHNNLDNKDEVLEAIKHWNNNTTLRFIEWSGQSNYIFFKLGTGTFSNLGMIEGGQEINIAENADLRMIIHEIGHSVGLIHEHSRSNRDDYIVIHYDNIIGGINNHNFARFNNTISQYDDFDYNSVMLYPCYTDGNTAIDVTKPIITKTLEYDPLFSSRPNLSQGDINTIKYLYPPIIPSITTSSITNITQNTATGGGNVTSDGGAAVTARGICWNTTGNPTTANSKTTNGSGTGTFTSNLTSLSPNTPYYVRAYATNSQGTTYGNQVTFTTDQALTQPTVSTTAITAITQTTATGGGNVTSDGSATVTARGVCWNTAGNPTTSSIKTSNGTGTGTFTSNLTGLSPNTPYYVRAYATNSQGTAYGSQVTFTTGQTLTQPTVTTNVITDITQTTATSGGNVTSDGGTPVTTRGVCWNTIGSPTTANSKTTNGTGTGTFTSNLTGLSPNTPYYVRAYATNSQGTAYGNEVTFTTSQSLSLATVIVDLGPTSFDSNSANVSGSVTSDGNTPVTERGFCWNTSTNPTTANYKLVVGSGIGAFSGTITGLTSNTNYYYRTYAINSMGTAYSDTSITFTTNSGIETSTVSDVDGNVYQTVKIGDQWWMAENLKTTKYNDGTITPNVTDGDSWAGLTTGAYCWYNNDIGNKNTYGALYNWYAVNTGRLAPIGWHVPSFMEWVNMWTFLGGNDFAGGKLKEAGTSHWSTPNTGATNESGFTALPGGELEINHFYGIGLNGYWWSSNESNALGAWYCGMYYRESYIFITEHLKKYGMSVRCVRDY